MQGYSPKAAKPLGPGTAWGRSPEKRRTAGASANAPGPCRRRRTHPRASGKLAVGYEPEESECQRLGNPSRGNARAIGRGIPCRCRTRRAHKTCKAGGARAGDGRGARSAGQMPERRGANDPGEIARPGPRRQWPGMKPGHHRRSGMKPGRPKGFYRGPSLVYRVFKEVPRLWVFIAVFPPLELHGHGGLSPCRGLGVDAEAPCPV